MGFFSNQCIVYVLLISIFMKSTWWFLVNGLKHRYQLTLINVVVQMLIKMFCSCCFVWHFWMNLQWQIKIAQLIMPLVWPPESLIWLQNRLGYTESVRLWHNRSKYLVTLVIPLVLGQPVWFEFNNIALTEGSKIAYKSILCHKTIVTKKMGKVLSPTPSHS